MSPYSKIVVGLTTAGTLGFFLTAKALSIGDTYPQPKTENTTPLRGCFSTHDKAEGVIIGEDEIYYDKVWRDGEEKVFEFHGLNLKNMNVLPKSDDNKIRFSGKYLDLDEKGCAVPTTSPQFRLCPEQHGSI